MDTHGSKKTWLLARFDQEKDFIGAAEKIRSQGHDHLDGFMPYPSHAALAAVKPKPSPIPWMVFVAAHAGFFFAFSLMYYCNVYDYPINIGGRQLFSPTVYIPIAFECVVLFSVLTSFLGTILLGGMPMPYHPFFTSEGFNKASTDSFILAVHLSELEKAQGLADDLKGLGAFSVEQVTE
jgi:hypothetical protein